MLLVGHYGVKTLSTFYLFVWRVTLSTTTGAIVSYEVDENCNSLCRDLLIYTVL